MAAECFDRALALVLELEGGFVDNPSDPGGATNLGITRATLAKARGRPVSVADVRSLTRDEAGTIYRQLFWDPIAGDRLPAGLDIAVFDYAVNSGPGRAARAVQQVLGVRQDGRIGPETLAAASAREAETTVRALTRERLGFLRSLSTWPVFGRGWMSRTTQVEAAALAAAKSPSGAATQPIKPRSSAEEKAMTDTKSIFASRTVWANLIGLGSVAAGLFGVQTGAIDQNGLADALAQVAAGASFIASTYFRLQATKQIAAGKG